MPVTKPYPHIYRHGSGAVNAPFFLLYSSAEIQHFLASYEVLKQDLRRVFEYVEPYSSNLGTFSHRLFELLLRASTEVESLCRLVFAKNGVKLRREANILRFSDLEGPMKLSEYTMYCPEYRLPDWVPFSSFRATKRSDRSPGWYRAYNAVKHDRGMSFERASLESVLHAASAVYVLLVAQIGPYFDSRPQPAIAGIRPIHGIIRYRQLPKWNDDERYEFNWSALSKTAQPYEYHPIPERP